MHGDRVHGVEYSLASLYTSGSVSYATIPMPVKSRYASVRIVSRILISASNGKGMSQAKISVIGGGRMQGRPAPHATLLNT